MGEVIADRFEMLDEAARGAMGAVHRARDTMTGDIVAVKVSTAFEHSERFAEEATALSRIEDAAVVRYVGHGLLPDGRPYIAMQWIEGNTLSDTLRKTKLERHDAVALVGRIARGLGAAHRAGIVHRDIKPGNIMLKGGSLDAPVLVDFGLARRHGHAGITSTGVLLGTPSYMAPEQVRGQRDLDARADVFALGCLLFRCLVGRVPFGGTDAIAVLSKILLESPPRLRDELAQCPPALDRLMAMMLAKEPASRPADAHVVASLLESFDWGEPTPSDATTMTLGAGEQRVVSVLVAMGELTDEVAEVMRAHGARAEQLLYGAIVGLLSGSGSEQATVAARCALALRSVLPDARIALATGRADVSGLAPRGEVIDAAAALLRMDTAAGVRLDDATRGLLGALFDVEDDVLVGESQRNDAPARKLMGKATRFIGRDHEVGSLRLFVQRTASEGAGVTLVTAPPGMGKTRLRAELVAAVRRELPHVEVWHGRADVMRAGSPFGLVRQIFGRAFDIEPTDDRAAQAAKVERGVAQAAPSDRERTTAFICEMMDCTTVERSDVEVARRDAQTMRDLVQQACIAVLQARTQANPVLLVLDDLHWADSASVALLGLVLDACADLPFGVVAFARPEVHETFPTLFHGRSFSELRLGPLSKRSSIQLVREAVGSKLDDEAVARLVDVAGGNAFYLEELVRRVASGRAEGLPATVIAMSQTRLEHLDPELRRTLRAAAVFGASFWRGGVALLTGADDVQVTAWLGALEGDELVSRAPTSRLPGEVEYAFRHALVREVAYATLTEADAEGGHGLAEDWLVAHGERDAHVLAEHALKSVNPARAVPHVVRLAELALDAGAWPEAVRRAEQARALGASGADLARAAFVLAQLALWEGRDGTAAAAQAVEGFEPGSALWCRAVSVAAVLATRMARYETHETLTSAVLAAFAATPTQDVAAAVAQVAFARLSANHDSVVLYELLGKVDLASLGTYARVRVEHALFIRSSLYKGVTTERIQSLRDCVDALEALGDVRGATYFRNNLAYGSMTAGNREEAVHDFTRLIAASERLGMRHNLAHGLHSLGIIEFEQGHIEESRRYQQRALDSIAQDMRLRGQIQAALARLAVVAAELDEAESYARAALDTGVQATRAHAVATLALVALARKDPDAALSRADEAIEAAPDDTVTDETYIHTRLARAEALVTLGRLDDATDQLAALSRWHEGRRQPGAAPDPFIVAFAKKLGLARSA